MTNLDLQSKNFQGSNFQLVLTLSKAKYVDVAIDKRNFGEVLSIVKLKEVFLRQPVPHFFNLTIIRYVRLSMPLMLLGILGCI